MTASATLIHFAIFMAAGGALSSALVFWRVGLKIFATYAFVATAGMLFVALAPMVRPDIGTPSAWLALLWVLVTIPGFLLTRILDQH